MLNEKIYLLVKCICDLCLIDFNLKGSFRDLYFIQISICSVYNIQNLITLDIFLPIFTYLYNFFPIFYKRKLTKSDSL